MTGTARRRFRVTGVVQGVGFRPYVYRLATSLGVAGHVGNDDAGVFIEAEASPSVLDRLERDLVANAPDLARIESLEVEAIETTGAVGFEIVLSTRSAGATTLVSADLSPCSACLSEMRDPTDRRHRYPYINCTNCGPRFTITTGLPYDRPHTTMRQFPMCASCAAEYDDPDDRRFHAQPIACWDCGPRYRYVPDAGGDPVQAARRAVLAGEIVAIKGVGGFHLACRADADEAVMQLRQRKKRPAKPLAVMVADLPTARHVAILGVAEEELLSGPERPIVLVRRRPTATVSDMIAPGNGTIGLMLPSAPLHELLLEPGDVWVMTSGNLSDEPLCVDDAEALERLDRIADGYLLGDRPIHVPCDDSVMRVVGIPDASRPLPIRRSRGYAPYPVMLRGFGSDVLAVGGELKSTICVTRGRHAFLSQHIGDTSNLETLEMLERVSENLISLFEIEPQILACDLHPAYLSSSWAEARAGDRPLVRVQHHHAHVASLLAEHRREGPIIGIAFDGTGYGHDGTVWGGEVLVADIREFERVGHLAPSLLAGGDAAVRAPWRQALARLHEAGIDWDVELEPVAFGDPNRLRIIRRQLEAQINTVVTTSMGRLFDAVSSLLGVCHVATYEGQAAIELETIASVVERADPIEIPIDADGVWQTGVLMHRLVEDVRSGVPVEVIAHRFHVSLANAIVAAARTARASYGQLPVGLTGGVFQNTLLTTLAESALVAAGFDVLTHRLVPPNDGGLALGQAVVARAQLD